MKAAARQSVKWRTLGDDPFAEAKREDKLLFLTVGLGWNWNARQIDKNVFTDPEIAERLNREFIPVRIDASLNPEWLQGPFPLSTATSGVDPGFYILVTSPDGTLLGWLGRSGAFQRLDSPAILGLLYASRRESLAGAGERKSDMELQTNLEQDFLLGSSIPGPTSLESYVARVVTRSKQPEPFEANGWTAWRVWDWRALVHSGHVEEAASGLKKLFESGMVDWLHGSVSRVASEPKRRAVKFESTIQENAELCAVLALISRHPGHEDWAKLARFLLVSTLSRLLLPGPYWSAAYSETSETGRAIGLTVRPNTLRKEVTGPDQTWMVLNLGLDPAKNPAMTPIVTDLDSALKRWGDYENAWSKLRKLAGNWNPELGGNDLLEPAAFALARLTEAARMLNDAGSVERCRAVYASLATYVSGGSVVRSLDNSPGVTTTFGDYMSYCDASLQIYLSTGDLGAFQSGLSVLQRAQTLFLDKKTGIIRIVSEGRGLTETPWTSMPNVTDVAGRSSVATYIDVTTAYGTLMADKDLGRGLLSDAKQASTKFGALSTDMTFSLGSLTCSILRANGGRATIVTGPDAVRRAADIEIFQTAYPAVGSLRKDLQAIGNGLHLTVNGAISR